MREKAWDLLTSGLHPRRAASQLVKTTGCSRCTANRYISSVIAQMQSDALTEPLESKKARLVGMLHDQIALARARTKSYVNMHGDTVTNHDPDVRGATAAIALLAQIEGVDKD